MDIYKKIKITVNTVSLINNKNINYDIIDENIDFDEMIEEDD